MKEGTATNIKRETKKSDRMWECDRRCGADRQREESGITIMEINHEQSILNGNELTETNRKEQERRSQEKREKTGRQKGWSFVFV